MAALNKKSGTHSKFRATQNAPISLLKAAMLADLWADMRMMHVLQLMVHLLVQ